MINKNTDKMTIESRNVAIVYRLNTSEAVQLSKKISEWLKDKGYSVYTAPEQKVLAGTKKLAGKNQMNKMGLVIVVGGDGTYLRAVRIFNGVQVPIVGINMGSLGFLTIFRAEEAFDIIEKTLQNKMITGKRSMIQAKLFRKGKLHSEHHALNDIVIERGSYSQLINMSIYSDKFLVSSVKADGFIIATPTGSTAYNLAAGGPILHPEVKSVVVTPISPHSLTIRPLLFPDNLTLTFKLGSKTEGAHFIVDGQKQFEITKNDEVKIEKSKFEHVVVRDPAHNFYHLLREKLKFGERA